MSGIIDLTSDDDENARRQPLVNDENGSDEEDEDLKLAIALSLQDQVATETSKDRSLASPVVDDTHQPAPSTATSTTAQGGLLGLDRRAMEAERLARLKRKREPEGDTRPLSQQPSTLSTRISPPPTKAQKSAPAKAATCPTSSSTKQSKAQPSFPTPQVLLTSDPSRHDPTNPSKYTSISFADIVKPPTPNLQLKSVLLSSFITDFDWILPHFNTRTTNFLLILHAQNAQHRALLESDFAGLPNVKLAMPSLMGGAGNMHSKIMLLFYADSNSSSGASAGSSDNREVCRIVVPSANLTRADWGVGGVMENILTVVDLPLKSSTDVCVYRFEKKLKAQMAAMEVPESVLRKVERFDFAATGNVEFVYSMSGSNLLDVGAADTKITLGASQFFQREKGKLQITAEPNTPGDRLSSTNVAIDDPARTGLLSLNDAVVSAGLGVSTSDARDLPQVDFVTSSLGNLTTEFVRQLYLAICGQLNPAAVSTKSKRSSTNMASNDVTLDEHVLQNLKIYFPSSGTVHRSKGGPGAGGTICFQRKWWNSNELIRHCLHDCVGVRDDGILMHSKILYVRFKTPKIARDCHGLDRSFLGWAYVGSANLSESAWGRVVNDIKSKQPKLTCRNWESGILLPVEQNNTIQTCKLRQEATAALDPRLSRECSGRSKSVTKKETRGDNPGENEHEAPTAMKSSVKQDEVGKQDKAHRPNSTESGERKNALDPDEKAGVMSASMQKLDMDRSWKPSLVEVFSGVLPVPFRYPGSAYMTGQQTPWFFME